MSVNVHSGRSHRWIAACVAAGFLIAACGSDDPDSASTATVDTGATATVDTGTSATAVTTDVTTAPPESDDTTAPATDSGATGDPCADREALRSSIGALADVDIVAEGTDGLTAAIDDVKDDLDAVQESAGDDIQPEVDAVKSALDDVDTAMSNGPTDDLAGTADALTTLASAATDLLEAIDTGECGASVTT